MLTSWSYKTLLAPLFASGLIVLLVVFALQVLDTEFFLQPKLTVREVTLAALPPPPPQVQPIQKTQDSSPNIQLDVDGQGAQLQFSHTPLNVDLTTLKLPEVQVENMQIAMLDNLNFDWQGIGLSELDELPRLLTQLSIRFPESLKRRGIKTVDVELTVMIDEKGAVLLKRIAHNPYPELSKSIKKLVRQARFSIPKKDGVAVRTTFNWPVEFGDV